MKDVRIERPDGTIITVKEATPAEISELFRLERVRSFRNNIGLEENESRRELLPPPPSKPLANIPAAGLDPPWSDVLARPSAPPVQKRRPTVIFGPPEEDE